MRKKRIGKQVMIIVLLVVAATATVRGISAYFTDAQEKTNTLTVGNVKTGLEEPDWDKVPSDEKTDLNPNQTVKRTRGSPIPEQMMPTPSWKFRSRCEISLL